MAISPDEMLKTARELSDHAEERHWRAAAHQAYYAVYHLACRDLGLDPDQSYHDAKHAAVLARVKARRVGSSRCYRLHRHLGRLRDLRVRANYALGASIQHAEILDAVQWAEDIFRAPA
jgi:uncharacterized protein (UPF0332 family)